MDMRATTAKAFQKAVITPKNYAELQVKSNDTGIPLETLLRLTAESIFEIRDKETRVRDFYEHRFKQNPENWFLMRPAHNYWAQFNTEDIKRKNKVQASGLHEIDPILWCIRLIQAGILPQKITYQVINGKRHNIPPEQQSIQHLFCLLYTSPSPRDRQKSRMPSSA